MIELVGGRVLAGELVTNLDDLFLELDRVRSQQPAIGTMLVRRTIDQAGSQAEPIHVELDARSGVGDIGNDLDRRPEPVVRDSATAWRPRSSASAGSPGYSSGMCMSETTPADEEGTVELLAAGSSPTSATPRRASTFPRTPRDAVRRRPDRRPAPCRTKCPRSPSYAQSGWRTASWEPITALAASSSFSPGWVTTRQIVGEADAARAASSTRRAASPGSQIRTPRC